VVEEPHPILDAYARRVAAVNPLLTQAGLHVVVPLALALIVVLLMGGAMRPVDRASEDAGALITGAAPKAQYGGLDRKLDRIAREQGASASEDTVAERAVKTEMMSIAVDAKLRGCAAQEDGVFCDGRQVDDVWITLFYMLGAFVGAFALFIWLLSISMTTWMLPYRSPSLWYTPFYGLAIALLTAGPFAMAAWYFHRADNDYHLAVDRSGMPTPSWLLYLLLVLQVTAVIVAILKARTPAGSLARWAGFPLLAIFLAGYAATVVSGTTWFLVSGALVVLGILLGPVRAAVTEPAHARGLEHGRPRIFELSVVLLIAWTVFAVDLILGADGILHTVLATVCLAVCGVHVVASRGLELSYPQRPHAPA
jgi:hypothetical protein